jgi:mannose-6-phosphate isomerase-like protein (cupin superfamily)
MDHAHEHGKHHTAFVHRSFDKPDQTRDVPNARIEVINLGHHKVSRATAKPGWKWTRDVSPVAKTDLCQTPHTGYVVSGALTIQFGDKTETIRAGEAYEIPAGHDAWVEGDETAVMIDFDSKTAEEWGKHHH